MAKIFTVNGANPADEHKRLAAFMVLDEQPTDVLERLIKLAQNQKAVSLLKSPMGFGVIQLALSKM